VRAAVYTAPNCAQSFHACEAGPGVRQLDGELRPVMAEAPSLRRTPHDIPDLALLGHPSDGICEQHSRACAAAGLFLEHRATRSTMCVWLPRARHGVAVERAHTHPPPRNEGASEDG